MARGLNQDIPPKYHASSFVHFLKPNFTTKSLEKLRYVFCKMKIVTSQGKGGGRGPWDMCHMGDVSDLKSVKKYLLYVRIF